MELVNYNQTIYQIGHFKNVNILHIFIANIIYIMIVILCIIIGMVTKKTNRNISLEEKLNNLEVKLITIEDNIFIINKNINTILRVIKELKKLD